MTKKRVGSDSIGGKHGASCGELLTLLNEYVDGDVDPKVCKEFEAHLTKCNPCRVVVDNVRRTITLYRQDEECKLPESFRRKLHTCLRKHWKAGSKTGNDRSNRQ